MRVGDIEVIPLSDGVATMPAAYFRNADWERHRDLLDAEGNLTVPLGCFVVRSGEQVVLVDAGAGPGEHRWFKGGRLPQAFASAGLRPDDIDIVVCTHLHEDHAGWLAIDGQPVFPHATVRFGRGDWDRFVMGDAGPDRIRDGIRALADAGRVAPIDRDGEVVVPGMTVRAAPGHTPGHLVLVLSSGAQRALLLGDAVTCPIQLEEADWQAVSDVDPELAGRTREALWRELEGTDDVAVASHFPDLRFGRVLAGEGRRWFTPAAASP